MILCIVLLSYDWLIESLLSWMVCVCEKEMQLLEDINIFFINHTMVISVACKKDGTSIEHSSSLFCTKDVQTF